MSYARNRFSLRRVDQQGPTPQQQQQQQPLAGGGGQRLGYSVGKFKLVRAGVAAAPQRAPNSPGPPHAPAAGPRQQQVEQQGGPAASRGTQTAPPPLAPRRQQLQPAKGTPVTGSCVLRPATKLTQPSAQPRGGTVKVLDRRASSQPRVLVYSKSKGGRSLKRTGVRAVAAKQAMTWAREPAPAAAAVARTAATAAPAGPGTKAQAAAVAGTSLRGAAVPPKHAAVARQAASPVPRKATKWNKYVRSAPQSLPGRRVGAVPPLQQQRRQQQQLPKQQPALVAKRGKWSYKYVRAVAAAQPSPAKQLAMRQQLLPLTKRAGTWNKYVRASQRASPARTAASTGPAAAAQRRPSPHRAAPAGQAAALPRKAAGSSKAQRLLRLGSSMYKVLSKGGARSLHRQRSSPLPAQQQQQQQQQQQTGPAQRQATPSGGSTRKQSPAAAAKLSAKLKPVPSIRKRPQAQRGQSSGAGSKGGGGGRIVFCPVYCRTGKCERRGKGCPFRHDPIKRAVCPRWLHGKCADGAKCLLQHQRRRELMPACMHFLKGLCTATDCPYLHVNLAPGAPVCKAFLRGHCAAGADCPHKHYTLRMVKEERRLEQQGGAGAEASGGGKQKKKRGGRYFEAELPAAKRPRSGSDCGRGSAALAAAGEAMGAERQLERDPGPLEADFLLGDIIPL